MPPRRRHRQKPEPVIVRTPAEQLEYDTRRFAATAKATEQAQRAKVAAEQKAKREAADAAKELKELAERKLREERAHAKALAIATAEVEAAISTLKSAREARRGIAAAETAWKEARARLIEVETGVAPAWARRPATATSDDDADSASDSDEHADEASEQPVASNAA